MRGRAGYWLPVTVTFVNTPVAVVDVVWLDAARPISTLLDIVNVPLPTVVQVVPFVDTDAVIVLPERTRRTHRGAVPAPPAVLVAETPLAVRRWNASPLLVETIMKA